MEQITTICYGKTRQNLLYITKNRLTFRNFGVAQTWILIHTSNANVALGQEKTAMERLAQAGKRHAGRLSCFLDMKAVVQSQKLIPSRWDHNIRHGTPKVTIVGPRHWYCFKILMFAVNLPGVEAVSSSLQPFSGSGLSEPECQTQVKIQEEK